jgi:hypothetical protein
MPFLANIRAAAAKATGFAGIQVATRADWPDICRAKDKPSQLNRVD